MFQNNFPSLQSDPRFATTSPLDRRYNCIAYAMDDRSNWWWPLPFQGPNYWPAPSDHRFETVEAFAAAFATRGYEPCAEMPSEEFDVVALYGISGKVTHAAKRKTGEIWLSKLGPNIDIEHSLHAVEGPTYGRIVQLFRRHKACLSE
jgi:hypothetical protein